MTHVVIVGAYGSAGATVAEELVDEPGVELTLVDDGDPGGGLCILRGCMPSKEILSAAEHRFQARHDERLAGDPPEVDLESVVERKDDNVLGWAAHRRAGIDELTEREGVEFVHDTARFVDDRTVAVGDREITADYVVVATGSVVNVPDLPGIEDVGFSTSEDVLDATGFPDSGIVMGFGYVGLELVPYLAEAGGTDLTVIEHDDRPLDEADPEFGDALLDLYREEFPVEIRTNVYERELEPTDEGGVRLTVECPDGTEETYEADELFCFTGRRPNVDRLRFDRTAIDPDAGWVEGTMQARDDERVFVVGDVNGKEPVLHVAKEQAEVAAENVRRHRDGRSLREWESIHHHVVFSGLGVYPYARVGHSERSAREAGHDVVAATREASDDGVFESKVVPEGLGKLVVDGDDGTVLGWQGFHYDADVMAKTMQVVVEARMDVREIPDRAYHPTTPEILDGLVRECTRRLAGE